MQFGVSIALQAVPGAESVRGKSMFGFSFVQVTFGDCGRCPNESVHGFSFTQRSVKE
jgi:hypothetical protein